MNTNVVAVVVTDDGDRADAKIALAEVEALFAEIEAALSRFRPDSELSRLNRSAGQPFPASTLLYAVVDEALATARATGGLFDPTVLGALVAAGYDRSFELLPSRPLGSFPASGDTVRRTARRSDWRDVCLAPETRTITVPPGCGLDLGGIGKGWAVDRAAETLRRFRSFAIDAGGDIYASGHQADGTLWTIGVENPHDPTFSLLVLAVRDRAVATSTTARRRWQKNGRTQHHLIDPRTGEPSQSGVVAATVVADSVARAETLAKVALLLGPLAGLSILNAQPGVEGLLVLVDRRWIESAGFHEVRNGT